MFLDLLNRRNRPLIDAAITLHQAGLLPANTYVLDLDAIEANAGIIAVEASRLGMTAFAMTKQIGRNPDACAAIMAGGIAASVAVDMECARATTRAGMALGHIGHLVQVPRAEAAGAAAMRPANWTVFSEQKARQAAAAAAELGRDQRLLARVYAPDDEFYSGHEGGFAAGDILAVAAALDALDGAHFGGITTFPASLFDNVNHKVRSTHNLSTLEKIAKTLAGAGRGIEVNAPGTTSARMLANLANAGATQVEPGHALTGTTPWHAVEDLPETPAICYLTEVSHNYGGSAYCYGGGMYIDPVFPSYRVRAFAGTDPASARPYDATLPPPEAIDYYGRLHPETGVDLVDGDSVVFGFRVQAFVTRAYTAGVRGIGGGTPTVAGIWSADGSAATWPA
jgi:predicted amino acid racemase